MLPGFVAGHCDFHDCHIDLERLCDASGVEFRRSAAIGIDRRFMTKYNWPPRNSQ